MSKSCTKCVHKDVCLKREMFLFQHYFLTGRYGEVEAVKECLDIGVNCKDYLSKGADNE